jgi:hypothetical protein
MLSLNYDVEDSCSVCMGHTYSYAAVRSPSPKTICAGRSRSWWPPSTILKTPVESCTQAWEDFSHVLIKTLQRTQCKMFLQPAQPLRRDHYHTGEEGPGTAITAGVEPCMHGDNLTASLLIQPRPRETPQPSTETSPLSLTVSRRCRKLPPRSMIRKCIRIGPLGHSVL